MTGRSMVRASTQIVRGRRTAKLAKTAVRVSGERGRQKCQVIRQSCGSGGCGRLVISDLLLLELGHEVFGRMKVLARFSRAFALDKVNANSDERVLVVDRTVRGRMRKRALACLLLASSVLKITANLRAPIDRASERTSFGQIGHRMVSRRVTKHNKQVLVHATTDYG